MTDEPADRGTRTSAVPKTAQVVAYIFFGIVSLALVDPFGLEEASRLRIQDGVNRVVADRYPTKVGGERERCEGRAHGAARVTLALWHEEDLTRLRRSWPLSYRDHAWALWRIAKGKPRAIFVDVLFKDLRPNQGIEKLRRTLFVLWRRHIRLYVVNGGGCSDAGVMPQAYTAPDPRTCTIAPAPAKRASVPGPSPTATCSERGVATTVPAPRMDDTEDGVTREYHLFADKAAKASWKDLRLECTTAALRMHLDDAPEPEGQEEGEKLSDYWRPLVLWWGTNRPPASRTDVVENAGRWIFDADLRTPAESLPFKQVRAADLLKFPGMGPGETVGDMFGDTLVIYGTAFEAAADEAATAIHEEPVSGAAVHAMALDNLQCWGPRYVRRYPVSAVSRGGLGITWIDVVMLMLGGLTLPLVRHLQHAPSTRRLFGRVAGAAPAHRHYALSTFVRYGPVFLMALLCNLLVPFLLAAIVGTVAFYCLGAAPVNFAAHAFVWIFANEAFELYERFEERDSHHKANPRRNNVVT